VALHDDDPDADLVSLNRELAPVRQRDSAINDQLTENGLTAIGTAMRDDSGAPRGAVAVAHAHRSVRPGPAGPNSSAWSASTAPTRPGHRYRP
jgi:DNA-binding IclR family transcriptional regulator